MDDVFTRFEDMGIMKSGWLQSSVTKFSVERSRVVPMKILSSQCEDWNYNTIPHLQVCCMIFYRFWEGISRHGAPLNKCLSPYCIFSFGMKSWGILIPQWILDLLLKTRYAFYFEPFDSNLSWLRRPFMLCPVLRGKALLLWRQKQTWMNLSSDMYLLNASV